MRDPIQPVHRRRPSWVVPAAIIAGAVAAIALGSVVGFVLTGTRNVAQGDPPPTPSSTTAATLDSAPTAEPSTAPTPTPDRTPITLPIIPNAAIAAITVEALAVWSDPNPATNEFGELGAGARLFVIGEPVELDDERWYRIAYVDGPRVSGFDLGPCQLNCGPSLGYVATPASGEDAWLEEVAVDCPSSPMTADQLVGLLPLERLSCYGISEITVTGALEEGAHEPSGAFTPEWLAESPPWTIGGGSLSVHFPPDFAGDLPAPMAKVRMVGHFEDTAAPTCRVDDTRVADGPSTAEVVLRCRTEFVVTDIEVLAAP